MKSIILARFLLIHIKRDKTQTIKLRRDSKDIFSTSHSRWIQGEYRNKFFFLNVASFDKRTSQDKLKSSSNLFFLPITTQSGAHRKTTIYDHIMTIYGKLLYSESTPLYRLIWQKTTHLKYIKSSGGLKYNV